MYRPIQTIKTKKRHEYAIESASGAQYHATVRDVTDTIHIALAELGVIKGLEGTRFMRKRWSVGRSYNGTWTWRVFLFEESRVWDAVETALGWTCWATRHKFERWLMHRALMTRAVRHSRVVKNFTITREEAHELDPKYVESSERDDGD